jgi:predicted nucleotidyltransferase
VVRVDPALHVRLRDGARAAGVSLNDYCIEKLAAPHAAVGPAAEAVHRAASMLGAGLVAVAAYGSWARAEEAAESDVDLLVVVAPEVAIVRELYRQWDRAGPIHWDGHAVEPHFAHLPEAGERITGLWAEAAVDGVVLFDHGFRASKRLVEIRRRIVLGEVMRRWSHGQPYWVEAA